MAHGAWCMAHGAWCKFNFERSANSEAFFGAECMAQKLQVQSTIDKIFFINVGRMARGAWRIAHGVRRMAQIRSGRGARRRILFYETENIIPGAFCSGARRKWFYEVDPWFFQSRNIKLHDEQWLPSFLFYANKFT